MRELTFNGFLKEYVKHLSKDGSTSVFKLAREATDCTPRLREPLFLYALFADKTDLLKRASSGTVLEHDYADLLANYDKHRMLTTLQSQSKELPSGYLKVWNSYCSRSNKKQNENELKTFVREQVLNEQAKKGFTNYRLYKDLNLNAGNLNTWLKDGDASKVSLATAKRTLDYARQL